MNAYPVGTSGIRDVTVVEKVYGMKADAEVNNNKFYALELHQAKNGGGWRVYVDYGRVGKTSTKAEYLNDDKRPLTEADARAFFAKQATDKFGKVVCSQCASKGNRPGAEKCACGRTLSYKDYPKNNYIPVQLAQTKVGSTEAQAQVDVAKLTTKAQAQVVVATPAAAPKVMYHPAVAGLISHIYEEAGHAARTSLNTGALKATVDNPLGTLSSAQIEIGKEVLADVASVLNSDPRSPSLMGLTSRWYTTIPQAVGVQPDWQRLCLNDWTKYQAALDLLDLLGDVKGVQATFAHDTSIHDRYQALGARIESLDRSDPNYRKLEAMCLTISPHHRGRFGNSKVRNIFKFGAGPQKQPDWLDPRKVGNHEMMFHGSRNANMVGIMSKGLLLRPPGVVITGSMFGNGLYFSPGDCASKSMQYADGGWGGVQNRKNTFYLFLVTVAQGRVMTYYDAQSHLTRAPSGYDSVRGAKGRSLVNDEHIIYDLRQHRLDYVVEIDPSR